MSVVLDASALLVMLRGEAGARKVEGALAGSRMSVVDPAEVASHYHKLGMPDEVVDRMLRPLPIELVPADADLARGGAAAPHRRGRPVAGRRFCLALSKRDGLSHPSCGYRQKPTSPLIISAPGDGARPRGRTTHSVS